MLRNVPTSALNMLQILGESIRAILPSPIRDELRRQRRISRLQRYFWRNRSFPYSSDRQHKRYARQRMDVQQRNSHKPGTLQPKHIFGN